MLNILESYDLQWFITGDIEPPSPCLQGDSSQPNPLYFKWCKSDRLVKGWLTTTLSKDVLGIVVGLNTTSKVWHALVHAFARVSFDRNLTLKQRLTSITKVSDSLSDYLRKFKTICDELAAIGKPIVEYKKSWWCLMALEKSLKSSLPLCSGH